jgi:hypothetical protein
VTKKLGSARQDGASPLEALLELSRSASEDALPRVLSTVAETIHRSAGFASVVLNIFRPAWDDYEAALIIGQDGVEALAGTTIPRTTLEPLLRTPQRLPGVFFLPAESGLWEGIESSFVPDLPPSDEPDAWQAEDGLLVFLSDSDGQRRRPPSAASDLLPRRARTGERAPRAAHGGQPAQPLAAARGLAGPLGVQHHLGASEPGR